MGDGYDKTGPGEESAAEHIPVLRDIVHPGDEDDLPVLKPSAVVDAHSDASGDMTAEQLAAFRDALQLTISRELDYAIEGAVYERLQSAMEEVAQSIKTRVREQLDQMLPEIIQAAARGESQQRPTQQ